ncbi:MAG TPA: hypothetical protein VN153_01575, partial [Tahibacter sp.]|nr:hypothetical protein [Tahibacter sp.]
RSVRSLRSPKALGDSLKDFLIAFLSAPLNRGQDPAAAAGMTAGGAERRRRGDFGGEWAAVLTATCESRTNCES